MSSLASASTRSLTYEHRGRTLTLRDLYESNGARDPRVELDDDGIVDEVAVDRAATGDVAVRITPRELVCAVFRLAVDGRTDEQIAETLGRDGKTGRDWVAKLRGRDGIPSGVPSGRNADPHASRKALA